jgi:geranylgeranyl diphosphate synthase type II
MIEIKNKLDDYITKDIEKLYNEFRPSASYILQGGKMIRGIITLSLSNNYEAAAAIEYIHNATLILDDLPCMDNDSIRRNKPTVHCKFGESTANLLSYYLILTAQNKLHNCAKLLSKDKYDSLLESMHKELSTLVYGQFKDLNINLFKKIATRLKQKEYIKLIENKTGALYALSFITGYILSDNSDLNKIKHVKSAGMSFGICYQIIDDLNDYKTDKETGKPNIRLFYSKKETFTLFRDHLDNYRNTLIDNNIFNKSLDNLYDYLLYNIKLFK